MQKFEQSINQVISYIIAGILFLTPLFFLPITRDFLIYTKFYLFFFTLGAIIFLSFLKFAITKRFFWTKNPFFQSFFLIVLSYIVSILLRSPNKIQAIFNPNFGLLTIGLMISYYYFAVHAFTQEKKIQPVFLLTLSGFVSSLIALIFLINPFKNVQLSPMLAFLKNPYFNTVGNQIELLTFLIFVLTIGGLYLWNNKKHKTQDAQDTHIMYMVFLGFIALAIICQSFSIGRAVMMNAGKIILPPVSLSWYAAVEVLKNPITALFGIGVDNYAAIFTRVRDISYNMSDLWQITSFSSARSTLLHVLTETGLLGLAGLLILLSRVYAQSKMAKKETFVLFILATGFLIIFPPTFMLFFIFFTTLALITRDVRQKVHTDVYEIDLSKTVPLYIGVMALYILLLIGPTYFVGRTFMSEIYFKKSIDAIATNNLKDLYENQRQALIMNQYNEDFHINFSQTNLLVANNIAAKKKEDITDSDRETITQAIQASIQEAKAAVALNSEKVTNWQNLAAVYRNIINVAKDAEVWTVSAYEQAIRLDPQNPTHRLDLGGVLYLFANYPEAQKMFEQAAALKPDWSNAHYNLAWTYAQQKDYTRAVGEMQNVIALIDPKKSEADFKKAQKDLEEFKKNLPQEGQSATPEAGKQGLTLPSPPAATVEPKIQINNASPESTEGAAINR